MLIPFSDLQKKKKKQKIWPEKQAFDLRYLLNFKQKLRFINSLIATSERLHVGYYLALTLTKVR